jgi:hypothetical protein
VVEMRKEYCVLKSDSFQFAGSLPMFQGKELPYSFAFNMGRVFSFETL